MSVWPSVCLSVCMCVPYRSPHRSSDCDETFTSCCKNSRGSFGNLKKFKIVLAGVPGVAISLQGHTPLIRSRWNFHKLLETCSRWCWKFNLYIKINGCVGYLCVCVRVCVPYRSTHRSSDGDETFKNCCKHARDGVGNLIYMLKSMSVCVCVPYRSIHRSSGLRWNFQKLL